MRQKVTNERELYDQHPGSTTCLSSTPYMRGRRINFLRYIYIYTYNKSVEATAKGKPAAGANRPQKLSTKRP